MKELALAGNPNSGKTSLFNILTGSSQHVGNWPGVTVEKKSGLFRKNKEIIIKTYREFTPCLLIHQRKWSVEIIF